MWGTIGQLAPYVAPIVGGIVGANSSKGASGAQVQGQQQAINQQNQTYGNVSGIYAPQRQVGYNADALLGKAFGSNGSAPDYSGFQNSPGYKFALQMGAQATNRNAAAQGGLYSANTLGAVNTNAQGIASQQYNNYIQQLMGMAGLGNQANAGTAQGAENAGNNISQEYQNIGNANASGILGKGNAIGNSLNQIGGLAKNTNWSQVFGGGSDPALSQAVSDGGLDQAVATSAADNASGIGSSALSAIGSGAAPATTEGIAGWGSGTAAADASSAAGGGVPAWFAGQGAEAGAADAGSTAALGSQVASGAETAGITPSYAGWSTLGSGGDAGGAAGGAAGGGADAASAGAGSIAGGLAGAGAVAGIAAYGASTQPYNLTGKYWDGVINQLTKGTTGNATFDKQTPPDLQKYQAQMTLYQQLQQNGTGNSTKSDFGTGGNAMDPRVVALAKQYGMLNADGTLNKNWRAKQPVAASAGNGWGTRLSTNTYLDPSLNGYPSGQGGGNSGN